MLFKKRDYNTMSNPKLGQLLKKRKLFNQAIHGDLGRLQTVGYITVSDKSARQAALSTLRAADSRRAKMLTAIFTAFVTIVAVLGTIAGIISAAPTIAAWKHSHADQTKHHYTTTPSTSQAARHPIVK